MATHWYCLLTSRFLEFLQVRKEAKAKQKDDDNTYKEKVARQKGQVDTEATAVSASEVQQA